MTTNQEKAYQLINEIEKYLPVVSLRKENPTEYYTNYMQELMDYMYLLEVTDDILSISLGDLCVWRDDIKEDYDDAIKYLNGTIL